MPELLGPTRCPPRRKDAQNENKQKRGRCAGAEHEPVGGEPWLRLGDAGQSQRHERRTEKRHADRDRRAAGRDERHHDHGSDGERCARHAEGAKSREVLAARERLPGERLAEDRQRC